MTNVYLTLPQVQSTTITSVNKGTLPINKGFFFLKSGGATRGNFVLDQSAHLFTFWPLSQSECVNGEFCKQT